MPETQALSEQELRAIAERALPSWDLLPDQIELISRSENTVFRIDIADGRCFALRIHRPGYHSLPELVSERQWTAALNEAGVHVPAGRPTTDGDGYVSIATDDGARGRVVGLVDWVEGVSLGDEIERETDPAVIAGHFEQLGGIAAAIHNQSSGWPLPSGFVRHAFDVPGYVGETPFWGRFWALPPLGPAQREILSHARDQIEAALTAYGQAPQTYSLIHADLHPANILVDAAGLHVIDFDDAGFGWHLYEFAVALYSYEGEPYYDTLRDALLTGYRDIRPFAAEDADLLPLFLLLRRLVILGWIWDRPELGYRDHLPEQIDAACSRVEAFDFDFVRDRLRE
jgi:Ser/Thr protein kinase RdoA (MazF antagonist)